MKKAIIFPNEGTKKLEGGKQHSSEYDQASVAADLLSANTEIPYVNDLESQSRNDRFLPPNAKGGAFFCTC